MGDCGISTLEVEFESCLLFSPQLSTAESGDCKFMALGVDFSDATTGGWWVGFWEVKLRMASL